jgi:alcohol dehydrogenase
MTRGGWEFHHPVRIVFGKGALDSLPSLMGRGRAVIVTTRGWTRRGLTSRLDALAGGGAVVFADVEPNPKVDGVLAAADRIRDCGGGDFIVAAGGGSAMDFGKALALLLAEPSFPLRDHLEAGAALAAGPALPVHAVPTTAGTGSEVTPFATLWDGADGRKYSLAGPRLFPRTAVLDPELTASLPVSETVSSGLDALSQGLESIWNRNATPISRAFAGSAVGLAVEHLPRAARPRAGIEHRERMMEASLLAGLAISGTRTALAHSMSYPLTARFGVPHGLACAFTLPALCRFNAAADDGRIDGLARQLGLDDSAALASALLELLHALGAGARLRERVPSLDAMIRLAPEMLIPGRADNNLRPATKDDVAALLAEAWHEVTCP